MGGSALPALGALLRIGPAGGPPVGLCPGAKLRLARGGSPVAMLPPRDEGLSRAQKPASDGIHRTVFDPVGNPFPALKSDETAIRIRAHVNGVPILDDEIREACVGQLRVATTDEQRVAIFNRTLDALIDTEVVMQDLKSHLMKLHPVTCSG